MDRKIKTRQVHKDIKVLDKTVTVTDHANIPMSEQKKLSCNRRRNPVIERIIR